MSTKLVVSLSWSWLSPCRTGPGMGPEGADQGRLHRADDRGAAAVGKDMSTASRCTWRRTAARSPAARSR